MIWGNVYVPTSADPGLYHGILALTIDGSNRTIPIRLKVRRFALSVENYFESAFDIWGQHCAAYYGIPMGSPEYEKLMERYYWFTTGYRMPPDSIRAPLDSPEASKYLDNPRVSSFRINTAAYSCGAPEDFKRTVAYLREKGWLSKGYIYTIDEPGPDRYAECASYGKTIDSLAKDNPLENQCSGIRAAYPNIHFRHTLLMILQPHLEYSPGFSRCTR